MLSFAALQDHRARYLLEDYTLNYVPAAGILQFTGAAAAPAAPRVPRWSSPIRDYRTDRRSTARCSRCLAPATRRAPSPGSRRDRAS